jgi:hypothetical protein
MKDYKKIADKRVQALLMSVKQTVHEVRPRIINKVFKEYRNKAP